MIVVREVAMSLRAMMLVAMRFAAVLSMGLFLTCGEAFAEVSVERRLKNNWVS